MAIKTSNVTARVEPNIKKKAEKILAELGISASSGINMFYRQIILWNGLPFRPSIPRAYDEMSKEEFDSKMGRALTEAENGEGIDLNDFFALLKKEVKEFDDK